MIPQENKTPMEPHPPHRQCGCPECAPIFGATPSNRDLPVKVSIFKHHLEALFAVSLEAEKVMRTIATSRTSDLEHFDSLRKAIQNLQNIGSK
ncbi:MAG: hypothetical protein KGI71_03950 [Patescibacteria group bacterium]|nr:hypothetical protein [Patescibacteria group bacterium]